MSYQSIDPKSIQKLPDLHKKIENTKSDYVDIKLKFIRPFYVTYLDQIFRLHQKVKEIKLLPWKKEIHKYLEQCGFEFLYGKCPETKEFDQNIIIPLRRFEKSDNVENDVIKWLEELVFEFVPEIETKLKKKIRGNLWEIVENSLKHGLGEFGVSACGQFYPQKNYFEVAFYDAGIGMAKTVKNYGAVKETEPDYECIKWALKKGNSTTNEPASGMGLYYLRNFINLNNGTIQIISGKGLLDCSENFDEGCSLTNSFDGTMVNIRINYNNGEGN